MHIVGNFLNPIMRPIFNVPGTGAFALAMGITSGYPVGAKVASDLYQDKLCTKEEAERLVAFTNSSGPLFIIGAIGIGMFNDEKIGLLLFLTHFLASLTVGILFRFYKKNSTKSIITQVSINSNSIKLSNIGSAMGEAIEKSISTLLLIGGYIVFFAVLSEILSITILKNLQNPLLMSIISGILEITNGIKKMAALGGMELLDLLPLVAFILGFGGFSVHMQVASILSETKLSMRPYLIGKFLQGIFASIYTTIFTRYIPFFNFEIISTFNYTRGKIPIIEETFNLLKCIVTISIVGIIVILIYKLFKIRKNSTLKRQL